MYTMYPRILAVILLAASLLAPSAMAQYRGWHLSAQAGRANLDAATHPNAFNGEFDGDGTLYGINAAYMFNRTIGIEAGLRRADAEGGGHQRDDEAEVAALTFGVVAALPVGDLFEFYGKLGSYAADAQIVQPQAGVPNPVVDDTHYGGYAALGGRFRINNQFTVGLDYSYYEAVDVDGMLGSANFVFGYLF